VVEERMEPSAREPHERIFGRQRVRGGRRHHRLGLVPLVRRRNLEVSRRHLQKLAIMDQSLRNTQEQACKPACKSKSLTRCSPPYCFVRHSPTTELLGSSTAA